MAQRALTATEQRVFKHLAPLAGRWISAVWRLAVVSADGAIPLLSTLVLEVSGKYAVLSYAQDGLTIAALVPRSEICWPTEPELHIGAGGAEEWLDLVDADDILPPLPLVVRTIDTWTVEGDYLAGITVSFSDGVGALMVTSTDAFDLVCMDRATALPRLDALAAVLSMRTRHTARRVG